MNIDAIAATADELGESALWDAAEGALYWLDLARPTLHRWDGSGDVRSSPVPLPAPLGALLPTSSREDLLLAAGRRLYRISRTSAAVAPLEPELGLTPGTHVNDAKTDATGAIWLSTADVAERAPVGGLVRASDGTGAPERFVVTNGPAFSQDGSEVYVSDSVGGRVLAYGLREGMLGEGRLVVQFSEDDGLPDGLAVDAEHGIWVAHWDAGCLSRHDPSGTLTARVDLPARHVTSLAFGGPDLEDLFVTTARYELSPAEIAAHPGSGSVFRLRPGVRGVPAEPASL
ncbi:SMP-30/Gluconolaconase/LRE domain protein [Beutenbergia cavernae DSM 12333]|uniref:SMP-30/Gluconolaconase/LRE domain protein n=1 Tax=Beutenbergia cavernae (strain ATCC BAA-8 / DSM 12333 / CCUG 43141 / JCM 11478 / NBRC 16432 / NCIMB 13614 / HKI 0122) TaxID=471853 RepID=C5BV16_BEUC1|nr:SMP-30/gluconolactonase/LRE family protein [Beutenbergia cavernae]ACQ78390.1 SMP-30/Gluconolaconase/LRE domain protein [Beutenbergia cavernae DSM 12333]